MPESYPLPDYAVSLWVAGDDLWLAFPGQGPEGKGHSVRLPASEAGFKTAITILRDRAQARDLKLGNKGTPTQYDLEAVARHMARSDVVAQREDRQRARDELKELGL